MLVELEKVKQYQQGDEDITEVSPVSFPGNIEQVQKKDRYDRVEIDKHPLAAFASIMEDPPAGGEVYG